MKTIGVWICMFCAVSVWGGDVLSPQSFQLVCPRNVVLDCDDDLSNLSKWGDAYVLKDYKKMSAGTPTVVDERNSCGIGIITRTWRVEDSKWKWHTCTQIIEVKGGGTFGYSDIDWPENWTVDTCMIDLNPRNLPDPYGVPKFSKKKCAHPAYSYRDEVFDFGPTCTKVVRYWKVIDWCQYKPGGRVGLWERPQVIKIEKGSGDPDVVCPGDTTIMSEDCDSADVELEDVIAISSCGDTLTVTNTSPYADSPFGNASGKYPIGVHTFYYVIEYGCAQELKCKVTISVVDAKAPTPYCKNGIITTLMPIDTNADGTIDDGMREVWASDLDAGSFHACDPHRKLTFSFSADTSDKVINFTCQNLGKNEVEIWVTDEFGNQSYCITYIMVQNNNPRLTDCEPDSLKGGGVIQGALSTNTGEKIKGGQVSVVGIHAGYSIDQNQDTTWYDMNMSYETEEEGVYEFRRLPMHKEYHVSVEKAGNHLNGVDIWDYYMLQFHLSGFFRLNDPLQLLAADLDQDGRVTRNDLQKLITNILYPADSLEHFQNWTFYLDEEIERYLTNGHWPSQDEWVDLDLSEKEQDVMWTGIKMGDLDFSSDPQGISQHQTSVRSTVALQWEEVSGKPGTYSIALPKDYVAGDMTLLLEKSIPVAIEGLSVMHTVYTQDQVRIAWVRNESSSEDRLFLQFDDEPGTVSLNWTDVKLYTTSGDLDRATLRTTEDNNSHEHFALELFPNPVHDELQLLWSSDGHEIEVGIYDILGRRVLQKKLGSFDEGVAHASMDVTSLEVGATYFIKMLQGDKMEVQSFIRQ